ncbi:hypothetical protein C8R45DRAFT_834596 [Mycena sanguinolenta]|nr:hypothetical protein C8R45DRAFT_834596 [Mycena sanguinolenta]
MQFRWAGVVELLVCSALLGRALNNEHHENWRPLRGVPLYSPDVDPVLKPQIDAAIAATANLPHYFWSGRIPPALGPEDSVEFFARDQARRLGGTTLQDTLINVAMPTFTQRDQNSVDTWVYASGAYANASRGVTYVWRAGTPREGNVFDTLEFPLLQRNQAVTAVIQINVNQDGQDQPFTIWPTNPASTVVVCC